MNQQEAEKLIKHYEKAKAKYHREFNKVNKLLQPGNPIPSFDAFHKAFDIYMQADEALDHVFPVEEAK